MNTTTKPGVLADWQVTYLNALDGKRHVLVDRIDEAAADAVLARFGDKRNAFEYMGPECKKERMGGAA